MQKNYVVDASVIVASPYSLLTFDEHCVIIPGGELPKIERFAATPGELGRNAQSALRLLDELRTKGNLKKGVVLSNGGILRVSLAEVPGEESIHTQLQRIQYELEMEGPNDGVRAKLIYVSNNPSARVTAALAGHSAEAYKTGRVNPDYPGRFKISCSNIAVQFLQKRERFDADPPSKDLLTVGQYVEMQGPFDSALGCFDGEKISPLWYGMRDCNLPFRPYDVTPSNNGQIFAVDALMAPADKVPLVILKGPAGTAKTFLALACGLEQVVGETSKQEDRAYDRILVARPNIKFDEDIGFLKGSEEDKIGPLIRPIWDNLEQLTRSKNEKAKGSRKNNSYAQYLFDDGCIVAQALAYMRGRSISNTWIIIDEAQNMTPLQAFGIISRAGCGTKIVLAGDPEQVDSPNLDRWNNGLSYASERMKGSPLCRQITFEASECERSPLALEAIRRLSLKGQN